jgi:hypothetical protein
MANLAPLGPTASPAAGGYHGGSAARVGRPSGGLAFHHVLAGAMNGARAPRAAVAAQAGVQNASLYIPRPAPAALAGGPLRRVCRWRWRVSRDPKTRPR